jgi:hypothetical protein
VTSFNSRTGAITLLGADVSAAGGALIASPTFTGTPAAPTPTPGDNTTKLATTAFVANALSTAGGVTSFNGRAGVVTLTTADVTGAGGAPLASPAFTGTPTVPTATAGTNTTQAASTAFVTAALAGHGPLAIQTFTASGTYTPTSGMTHCIVECIGGGAGGVGAYNASTSGNTGGGGGGSGGYSKKLLTAAQVGASQPVTIGAGGAGGVGTTGTSVPGSPGGVTSLGTLCVANGGQASPAGLAAGPGGSVTGAVGDLVMPGNPGGIGFFGGVTSSSYAGGGFGGSSVLGGGAPGTSPSVTAQGNAGVGPGGGGSGSVLFNVATFNTGGAGHAGIVVVTEYA